MKIINAVAALLVLSSCNPGRVADKRNALDLEKGDIFRIADSIVQARHNPEIWNLEEIDTSYLFETEDFFIDSQYKNRLVVVGGNAGLSAGSASNLLMLLSYDKEPKVLWSGQTGEIKPENIKDLNNDGIKEIFVNSHMVWMGECADSFTLFNFKGGRQNQLYNDQSWSVIDCGLEGLGEIYAAGDTLAIQSNYNFKLRADKTFDIERTKTIRLHNGGTTDEEITTKAKAVTETGLIKIF